MLQRREASPSSGSPTPWSRGKKVAVHEEIVLRNPFGQLKRFVRKGVADKGPPLLIVAPMSGHFATLLRGTVERMLPKHDVYITDWRDARAVPLSEGTFDLDDYIDYLIEFLETIGEERGERPHMLAVCQPAVPGLCRHRADERRSKSMASKDPDDDGRADRHA